MTRKKDDWGLLVITSVVCDYMCSLRNLAKVVEMRDKKENQIIRTMHIPIECSWNQDCPNCLRVVFLSYLESSNGDLDGKIRIYQKIEWEWFIWSVLTNEWQWYLLNRNC